MTRHALILGNNLTGLVTAYRLLQYGFRISVIDPQGHIQSTSPTSVSLAAEKTSPPLILHGFFHATWALLQELAVPWPSQFSQSVGLEFGIEGRQPITLPKPSRLAWSHPLTRLIFFKNLSWPDRWNIINFLEKQWEENRLSQQNPDNENVETWLIAAKQSARSRSHFWNPLCRFLLSCDLTEASLSMFLEVLSDYWFGPMTNATIFLTPSDILYQIETELQQRLTNKGAQFHSSQTKIHLHANTVGIQGFQIDHSHFQADAYVSALTPQDLLPLLPGRMLARYAYFSSLTHIQEVYGLALQFILQTALNPPRVILNPGPFDWICSQPSPESKSPKTIVTCTTLQEAIISESNKKRLSDNAGTCLHNLFNLSPTQIQESCELQTLRQTGPFFPYHIGSRTHRPLPKTPIPNFFLAGPWTNTNVPASVESTIKSANACAEAIAATVYGSLD